MSIDSRHREIQPGCAGELRRSCILSPTSNSSSPLPLCLSLAHFSLSFTNTLLPLLPSLISPFPFLPPPSLLPPSSLPPSLPPPSPLWEASFLLTHSLTSFRTAPPSLATFSACRTVAKATPRFSVNLLANCCAHGKTDGMTGHSHYRWGSSRCSRWGNRPESVPLRPTGQKSSSR